MSVDTGRLLIADPCYMAEALAQVDEHVPHGAAQALPWSDTPDDLTDLSDEWVPGVVVTTGYGDGIYPVIAMIRDGVVESVTVDFMQPQ